MEKEIAVPKRTREEIESIIVQWRESGKKKTQFCAENDINYQTFIGWTKPSRKVSKKNPRAFIPLIKDKTSGIFAELIFKGGDKIIFHQEVSLVNLRTLIN